ncbi:MFS transporter [bacterium DOLZORAL124_64_63]|nr:MAG: MFS transporter [bacterium DOLZORAL124_64_63]
MSTTATDTPRGLKMFPRAFWAANVMEIFERMGWYGFYAVSSLYLTEAVADGGLGFTSQDRGVIQGVVTFFLYLFPAAFGALADRYGYRAMFLASTMIMAPAYLLLQFPTSFWAFFAVYFLVAVGHGMFKPVVISTVALTTTEKTGSMGFGIFYMMVNVGGFLGPIIAGVVRGWSWTYVFWASAAWIVMLALTCIIFYKDPRSAEERASKKKLSEVFTGMIEVVGNGRFFLMVLGVLVVLVMGSKWWDFKLIGPISLAWIVFNILIDLILRAMGRGAGQGPWLLQPMQVGEGRYMVFLLLMAGFWTSFNQIFLTLPEYIRDYGDTSDLIRSLSPVASGITGLFQNLGVDTSNWSLAVLEHGQVKPEHLINLNAFGIILGQVGISYLIRNVKPLNTIINGVVVTVISFLVFMLGGEGWIIVAAILVFSVGEMMASPKSKEYAGRIAPPGKVGMYMGYFYWCTALGNLFGGLLSGVMYGHFGPTERGGTDNPDAMWIIFALLAASTALSLVLYDRWVQKNPVQAES